MAPKTTRKPTPALDSNGIFAGMRVFLVEKGVQNRRLQVLIPDCDFIIRAYVKLNFFTDKMFILNGYRLLGT